jgi:hypothetical protein
MISEEVDALRQSDEILALRQGDFIRVSRSPENGIPGEMGIGHMACFANDLLFGTG